MADHEQHVRELAYRLWEEAARPPGRAEDFWHAALATLSDEPPAAAAPAPAAAKPAPKPRKAAPARQPKPRARKR